MTIITVTCRQGKTRDTSLAGQADWQSALRKGQVGGGFERTVAAAAAVTPVARPVTPMSVPITVTVPVPVIT